MADYFYSTTTNNLGGWNAYDSGTNTLSSTAGTQGPFPTLYAYNVSPTSPGVYQVVGGNPSTTGPSYVVFSPTSTFAIGNTIDLTQTLDGAAGTYLGLDPTYSTPIIDTGVVNGYNATAFPARFQTIGVSTAPDGTQPVVGTFCFLSGTLIATPTGEIPVEDLKPGDLVSTAEGGTRKVLWIGQQKVPAFFGSPKNYPIEICISALGDNMPKRPLRVSPGHSLLIDGAFPIASALVNGYTVRQMTRAELPEVFTYYHVEVEDHALILAEGVPAETFLDAWSRRSFSNWQEYVELYGEEERKVPPSYLHYQRVLKFDDLPQSLKDTLGEPLDTMEDVAA